MPTKQRVVGKKLEGKVDGQIPTIPVNFDMYVPKRFGTYVKMGDEVEDLTTAINAGLPYLLEGEKGIGKTMLVTEVCAETDTNLVTYNCSSGTTMGDIIGREHLTASGSVFKLGVLPTAIKVANESKNKRAVLYLDELNALEPEIQKMLNPVIDDRRSIIVNNQLFELDDGVTFTIIASQNPSYYSGVNQLNEDLRSRFVGQVIEYPSSSQIASVIDWTDIPEDDVKDPLLALAVDTLAMKKESKIDYVISVRDISLFCKTYRAFLATYDENDVSADTSISEKILEKTIRTAILMKFSDYDERQTVLVRCNDVFGVNF
jgi:MoxR-like ATPase